MGQSQVEQKQKQQYKIVQQLSIGNIIKYNKSQQLCFIKQYSFTSQESYQNTLNNYSIKLSNKNQHILNFKHFTTKSQNSFCSVFYKIILIFEYLDYTLDNQINNRIKNNQPFNQKQIWSILCSIVLASVHFIHCQNKMHCGLMTKDIRLNSSGCVKLLHHQMIGIDSNHTQKQGVPKTLALTLIQCMSLQKLSNQENSYLQKVIEGLSYSRQMKDMLLMMLKKDIKFTQIQQHLFKLVQDDDCFTHHSNNTPNSKQHNLLNSNHKTKKHLKTQNSTKNIKIQQQKYQQLQILPCDYQDIKSYMYTIQISQIQIQNPDQLQKQITQQLQQQVKQSSPNKIDPFTIDLAKKQKMFDSSSRKKSYRNRQNYDKLHQQSSNKLQTSIPSSRRNKKQQHIFTDPKLFQIFKNDLQQMKIKISTGQLIKFNKTQQINNSHLNQQSSHHNQCSTHNNNNFIDSYLIPITNHQSMDCKMIQQDTSMIQKSSNSAKKQQKILDKKQQNYRINQLNNIQIIKQVSQEYKQDDQYQSVEYLKQKQNMEFKENNKTKQEIKKQEKIKSNQKKIQQNKIQNILNNNQIGFKKKKIYAKLQPNKQNSLHEQDNNQYTSKFIKPFKNTQNKNIQKKNIQTKNKNFKIKLNQSQNINHDYKYQMLDSNSGKKNSSASITNRIDKDQNDKDAEKLVHVNQKYNRGRYQGTKLNGKRQGYGTFYYSQGGMYIGNWKQNKMHGKGVLYYPNQQIAYDGQWLNDQLSGYGTLYNEEVTSLKIPFDYRDWSDVEDYWIKYQGHFCQDNKDGKGKLYLSNGERLEGEFHEDKVDGDGILYRGDGSSVKGKWRQNKLVRLF